MEFPMKTPFLAVTLLALSTSFAHAEVNSLSGKAMQDFLANKGGVTANPTARVITGSIGDKAVSDRIGLNTGRTADPLAQPDTTSLSGYEMQRVRSRS
jgi:hypothetical protein